MRKVCYKSLTKIPRVFLSECPHGVVYHCGSLLFYIYLCTLFAWLSTPVYLCQMAGNNSIGEGRGAFLPGGSQCKGERLNSSCHSKTFSLHFTI